MKLSEKRHVYHAYKYYALGQSDITASALFVRRHHPATRSDFTIANTETGVRMPRFPLLVQQFCCCIAITVFTSTCTSSPLGLLIISRLSRDDVKPVKCLSVRCQHFQNHEAPRPLSRGR